MFLNNFYLSLNFSLNSWKSFGKKNSLSIRLMIYVFVPLDPSFPATVKRGEKGDFEAEPLPAAIPAVLRLSGGRSGVGEGDGPRNRRAAVHRLGRCMPRSRVCSSSECGSGARFSSSSTAAELNNCSMAATLLWELLFLIADGVVRILVLRGESDEFCFSGCSVRLVVSLFAKGLHLLCSPAGLHFRVGAFVAGRGSCSTLAEGSDGHGPPLHA